MMKGLLNPEGPDPCLGLIVFCGDSPGPGVFRGLFQGFSLEQREQNY